MAELNVYIYGFGEKTHDVYEKIQAHLKDSSHAHNSAATEMYTSKSFCLEHPGKKEPHLLVVTETPDEAEPLITEILEVIGIKNIWAQIIKAEKTITFTGK